MRAALKYGLILSLCIFAFGTQIQAQKNKARLSVDYINNVGVEKYLDINSKFKGDDGYEPAANLHVNIYQQITEDSLAIRGEAITNEEGNAKFLLTGNLASADSIVQHIFVVKIEDDANFKNAKKPVKFYDSNIKAEIVDDSVAFVSAVFTDGLGDPIKKKKLDVKVHRLFAPLTVGDSPYKTDRKGNIMVSMADSLPGIDGILTIEVSHGSKKYGTVKYIFTAPIGTVVVDESTFDQRTMWAPPNKTPWVLIIIPGLLILIVWGTMVLLVMNLVKIYKS